MIAIKDMEMPKNCDECQFGCITYNNNRKCKISENCYTVIFTSKERPTDCPLVEIVTCKDCENWDKEWTPNVSDNKEYHFCPMADCNTAEDYYCADAERRE